MGYPSTAEDIQERLDSNLILGELKNFEDRQKDRLQQGTLTEANLRQEVKILKERILEPLRSIERKAGEDGLSLGNQLLQFQMGIMEASACITRLRKKIDPQLSSDNNAEDLSDIIDRFIKQYRIMLDVLVATTRQLSQENISTIMHIKSYCERDISNIKQLAKTLRSREEGIARLYEHNKVLEKELEKITYPERFGLSASEYDNWNAYTRDKLGSTSQTNISRTRKPAKKLAGRQ
ncbi:hypothetical protein [Rhodomicrobium udaipurense]|uniref:Uncharacterized protein n=1 Tax=Rhodomicrobium udaipurense TaxID=1202716 RepID=A0A8I1GDV7_9HYPH|nr:hypothetical protein [Rhodomicrobium udaipurense]MBJ7542663.1 hypothetical protein [Rhodomicrobium udaipurense]